MPTKGVLSTIQEAILAVMGEVSYVQKEKAAGMRYSIVSHDAVTALLRPALVKHGIIYHPVALTHTQNGNRTEVVLTLRFTLATHPDSFIEVPALGYGLDEQDKGPGKAISYAVKYALLKTFGLETGDDPDSDQTTAHVPEPTKDPVDGPITLTVTATSAGVSKTTGKPWKAVETDQGRFWNNSGVDFQKGQTYPVTISNGAIISVEGEEPFPLDFFDELPT